MSFYLAIDDKEPRERPQRTASFTFGVKTVPSGCIVLDFDEIMIILFKNGMGWK
jgi:hypothetical protein